MTAARLVPYVLAAIGLGAAAHAFSLHLWASGEPAAGLFPFLAALLLTAASLASIRERMPDGEPAETRRLLAYGFALGAFCVLLETAGFAVSTFLFLAGVLTLVERLAWKRAMLLAATLTVSIWTLFDVLLAVPLPQGAWRL